LTGTKSQSVETTPSRILVRWRETEVWRGTGVGLHPPIGLLWLANPHAAGVNPNFEVKER